MTSISLVLFDVNGVLYDYDRAARVTYLARLAGKAEETVDQAIWGSGLEDQGDAGTLSARTYLRAFRERLGYPLTAEEWAEAVRLSLTPVPGTLRLAERLGRRAKLGVLTNNNLLIRQWMDQLFPALRPIFRDAICVSSQFRVRKPEPEVYRRSVAHLGHHPGQSLFIDDSAANVTGAERAGLRAYCYTDEAALEGRLRELGLL